MSTLSIIEELDKLSLEEKLFVVEQTIKSIRKEKSNELAIAADALYDDYKGDKELTAFTELDSESFYEAR